MEKIKKLISLCFKSNITPLLWGNHGIGKSQVIKQYAQENNLELIDIRLGQLEPMDLLGLPEKEKDRTKWLQPIWFPSKGKGILFLDEINRGHPDVMQAIFQLVLDRKLHTHELPKDWKIICAANYNTANYSVNEMDEALINRFFHINMVFNKDTWADWAEKKNINPSLIKAVDKDLIKSNEFLIPLTTTPRSIEMLNTLIQTADKELYFDICKGLLNQKDVSTVLKYLGVTSYQYDILNDLNSKIIENIVDNKKLDIIHDINNQLMLELNSLESLTNIQLNNLTKYLAIIPKDVTIAFMKKFRNNPIFIEHINSSQFDSLRNKLSR